MQKKFRSKCKITLEMERKRAFKRETKLVNSKLTESDGKILFLWQIYAQMLNV